MDSKTEAIIERQKPQPPESEPALTYDQEVDLVRLWLEEIPDDRDYLHDIFTQYITDPDFQRTVLYAALDGHLNFEDTGNTWPQQHMESVIHTEFLDIAKVWADDLANDPFGGE